MSDDVKRAVSLTHRAGLRCDVLNPRMLLAYKWRGSKRFHLRYIDVLGICSDRDPLGYARRCGRGYTWGQR
jgi:hypothetical protein